PKALPLIVTVVPTPAADGVKPVTRGSTESVPALVAVPPAVATVIVPEAALAGTVRRSCTFDRTEKLAATPFTFTVVTPAKPVPATVTLAPAGPLGGVNEVSLGSTLNVPVL